VKLGEPDFVRLSAAFFAELEKKYLVARRSPSAVR
jgi:hypothetical protein